MLSSREIQRFHRDLLAWFHSYQRDLPWRRTRDPYAIWISEIMLQQTRVAAVIPYYECFLNRFPNLEELASAPESELLAYWAGLGYYYRARNLQRAARLMRDAGAFPATYEKIRELPGIGDYTAAAVASISFNLSHAVLDGNVFRVLSRVFDDSTNIATQSGRKHFHVLAEDLLDREDPGAFNQAMMELGATVCLPKNPQCLLCPVSRLCCARSSGRAGDLPVKIAARKRVSEKRVLFWIEQDGRILAWQRPSTSNLMPGFWELPEASQLSDLGPTRKLGSFRHAITFHDYSFDVVEASSPPVPGECKWIPLRDLETIPTSTTLRKAAKLIQRG
ncbi:MAG: A/G-specific adenine glycosylase [Bryobacteraceae bacterium]